MYGVYWGTDDSDHAFVSPRRRLMLFSMVWMGVLRSKMRPPISSFPLPRFVTGISLPPMTMGLPAPPPPPPG